MGAFTRVSGVDSAAFGTSSEAVGDESVAVGGTAVAEGNLSAAFGNDSAATSDSSTALGARAQADGANSVALGQGSVADRANSVSVGAAGAERQVTNVADGSAATDAVNMRQLDARFAKFDLDLDAFRAGIDDRFNKQDARINRTGAMNTAMSQMTASAAGIRSRNRLAVGTGYQDGYGALAVGYQRAINERSTFTIGAAMSGDGEDTVGMGFGIGW